MGLAWTSMGGATLYVEVYLSNVVSLPSHIVCWTVRVQVAADKFSKGNSFTTSGQMGDVMRESATLAYTLAKSFLSKAKPQSKYFEKVESLILSFFFKKKKKLTIVSLFTCSLSLL